MCGPRKRGLNVVDLTGDDSGRQAKRQSAAPVSSSTGVGGTFVYNTLSNGAGDLPGPGSQNGRPPLSSSQPLTTSQMADYEREVLDLTQDDEGPARELYGTFGKNTLISFKNQTLTLGIRNENCRHSVL